MRLINRRNLLLMLSGLPVGTLAGVWITREPTVPLTRETLDAARRHWRESGPTSYALEFRMAGADYRVVVKSGRVDEATVNGKLPTSGDWNAYSVDGLFTTLEQELENATESTGAYGDRKGALLMRVRFDSELGYVERYLRSGGGIGRGAAIEGVKLRRLE
jgi:hypothetical protein